jgi:NuA3 HAT complex component NTO1
MASAIHTTPRTARRGRPRKYQLDSEPPRKRRKYSPSGSTLKRESNGRFSSTRGADDHDEGHRNSRNRPTRRHSDMPARRNAIPVTPARNRHDPANDHQTSAAAAASAVSHGDNFKPREERSWEEFHPDLDIDTTLPIFTSDEIDGVQSSGEPPTTSLAEATLTGASFTSQMIQMLKQQADGTTNTNPLVTPPFKRRPGRPPKRPEAILAAMLQHMSPGYRIPPAPTINPKERLVLPKPSYRKIETFAAYEKAPGIGINFVEKTFANVGYQESDLFSQPRNLIRGGNSTTDYDIEVPLSSESSVSSTLLASLINPRVEYDMDEQDEKWLEVINAERTQQGVDPIRPQCFEITMTLIEKEWHALEKSKILIEHWKIANE